PLPASAAALEIVSKGLWARAAGEQSNATMNIRDLCMADGHRPRVASADRTETWAGVRRARHGGDSLRRPHPAPRITSPARCRHRLDLDRCPRHPLPGAAPGG